MRDRRVTVLIAFVVVSIGVLVALTVIVATSDQDPDLDLGAGVGQKAFDGLRVTDPGGDGDPLVVEGRGLVDRWIKVRSSSDQPLGLELDDRTREDAEGAGLSVRLGFLAGVDPASYPAAPPKLSTTLPRGGRGLLVMRVRVKQCPKRTEDTYDLQGAVDLTSGPDDAPRNARIGIDDDADDTKAGDLVGTAALRVTAPSCSS